MRTWREKVNKVRDQDNNFSSSFLSSYMARGAEIMKKLFDLYDSNKDGYLDAAELVTLITIELEPKMMNDLQKSFARTLVSLCHRSLPYGANVISFADFTSIINALFIPVHQQPQCNNVSSCSMTTVSLLPAKKLKTTNQNAVEGVKYTGPDPQLAATLEMQILETNPGVRWDDVAGLHEAKRILQEVVALPLWMPNYFQGIRRPGRGVLMFGPPGTGKTLLAKAVATECGTTFLNVSCPLLLSKSYGESRRLVRCLFDLARAHAPSTIFIDEVDSLCSPRGASGEHEVTRRVKSELLIQIDGLNNSSSPAGKPVTVMAATNFPWTLDETLRGRLEKRIYIPLPDFESRKELIKINLQSIAVSPNLDIDEVAQFTEGYSGDDLINICKDASLNGMRLKIAGRTPDEIRNMPKDELLKIPVTMDDLVDALDKIRPTVTTGDIERHMKWFSEFGST